MFIRHSLRCLLAFSFLFAGCAKEGRSPDKPVKVELKESGDCLSSFGENITRYQKGELANGQVEMFWSCVQRAVGDYQRLTSGDQAGGAYTPQALRRFLQKYFIKSQDIQDPLLASIMEIKRVLLSGSSSSISREELSELQSFLQLLKEASLDMNPYVKVIFMHSETASDDEIRRAGAVAESAMNRIGDWLDKRNQAYSFEQLSALIANLEDFRRNDSQTSDLFQKLRAGMEILPSAKLILLSGPSDRIRGREWRALALSLGQGLRGLLAAKYAFKEELNTALAREAIPFGMEFAVNILERGAAAHGKNEIPLSEWEEFFNRLSQTGWMPDAFSGENMTFAFRWLIDRTLARGHGDPARALTQDHLQAMKAVFRDWQMLRRAVTGSGPFTGVVGERFKTLIARSAPAEWDSLGRMAFPLQPAKIWTGDSQLRMVWPFVVMSWLKNAFVPEDQVEVGDEVMERAGLEILTTMRKFGWLKATKDTIGKKLLRESDLFTLGSNGNGTIDLYEATRYLVFIASSYRASQLWLDRAEKICGSREAECTRRLGGDLNEDVLSSMPRLKNWLRQKGGSARFVAYMKSGEETILEKVIVGEFGTADVLQVWMLFQYVETFLQRYDQDYTDTINLAEATPAFDIYGPILGKMLSSLGLPPEELFGFFTFMVKYGDTPFTMFGGQVLYNHWKWHRADWAFESERDHLMGILNQLSKL